MNNTTKIFLTIELEGSTLVRKGEKVHKYILTRKDLNPKYKGKKGKDVVKWGEYKTPLLEAKPCFQHINMTAEAYEYMTSKEIPEWANFKVRRAWTSWTKQQRLEYHLQRTCEHFGGKSFTYEVLED